MGRCHCQPRERFSIRTLLKPLRVPSSCSRSSMVELTWILTMPAPTRPRLPAGMAMTSLEKATSPASGQRHIPFLDSHPPSTSRRTIRTREYSRPFLQFQRRETVGYTCWPAVNTAFLRSNPAPGAVSDLSRAMTLGALMSLQTAEHRLPTSSTFQRYMSGTLNLLGSAGTIDLVFFHHILPAWQFLSDHSCTSGVNGDVIF